MMLETVGFFVLGLVLLALGGDSVVKGASGMARHFGFSPFLAGLVLVAFGTSVPELAVNLRAVAHGLPDLAMGNAVGSNIVNFGLTLGAAAVAAPLLVRWRALSLLLASVVAGTVLVTVLAWDGVLGRVDGALLVVAFLGIVAWVFARSHDESPAVRAELEAYTLTGDDLALNLIRFALAIVLLYFGSRFVVGSAPELGRGLGLLPMMTGLLPVAIGTALPEVAAAIAAARRHQGDMVAGHVIGASLFNLLLVLGGLALWNPMVVPGQFLRIELPAAAVLALMLVPMMRGDMQVSRREGVILLVAFAAWVGFELLMLR